MANTTQQGENSQPTWVGASTQAGFDFPKSTWVDLGGKPTWVGLQVDFFRFSIKFWNNS